jgi:class 3 adenylate cyclase
LAGLGTREDAFCFLFTDIEGSTRLLQGLGDQYREVVDRHGRILRDAIASGGGTEVHTEGDLPDGVSLRDLGGFGSSPGPSAAVAESTAKSLGAFLGRVIEERSSSLATSATRKAGSTGPCRSCLT